MRAKGRAASRFEHRWDDYSYVLRSGTSPKVGRFDPRLPDRREEVLKALGSRDSGTVALAERILDEVWAADAVAWRRRLQPFLDRLSPRASRAFAKLVTAGCQPDMLALRFHEAASLKESRKASERIHRDIAELRRLAREAVQGLTRFVNRRSEFDRYLEEQRLRVCEGEPGGAELVILKVDLEDVVERQLADLEGLRRQLDGRRQPLTGHPEVQLSCEIRSVTGQYHDSDVECVLNELLEALGGRPRGPGALKRRRARWLDRLGAR